jgi:outer membrane protein, multidrug efflux system
MHKGLLFLALSLFTCGCPGPTPYVRPQLPVPPAWPENSAPQPAASAADISWRDFYTDEQLRSVIALALENNRDLRMAALNIEKTQALYRIQRAEPYPTVAASAIGDAYRVPKTLSSNDSPELAAQYRVGLTAASWELDLFGRIRSLKSRALEQYLMSQQARSAAQISLVGAVAGTYLALAADQENLRIARETLEAQTASYELIRKTREFGMASDLDLRQAQSQVEAAKLDIARYSGQIALDVNALDLLAGTPVPADMRPGDLSKVAGLKDVAPGLPSDVLLRRPDILAAEHQLKSINANIGAARAAFFPRIALTAATGIASSDLINLFKPSAGTWEFAPQISIPIFDMGARQANLQASKVDQEIAVAEYEQSIQSAFREVSDALSQRKALDEQHQALQALTDTLQETYRLSEARYKGGLDGYLSVLVAQRSVYAAQQQMVGIRLARQNNMVTLYKVLGGGA